MIGNNLVRSYDDILYKRVAITLLDTLFICKLLDIKGSKFDEISKRFNKLTATRLRQFSMEEDSQHIWLKNELDGIVTAYFKSIILTIPGCMYEGEFNVHARTKRELISLTNTSYRPPSSSDTTYYLWTLQRRFKNIGTQVAIPKMEFDLLNNNVFFKQLLTRVNTHAATHEVDGNKVEYIIITYFLPNITDYFVGSRIRHLKLLKKYDEYLKLKESETNE